MDKDVKGIYKGNRPALFLVKGLLLQRKIDEDVFITIPPRPEEQFIIIWALENEGKVARILFNAPREIQIVRTELMDTADRPTMPLTGGYSTTLTPKYTQMIIRIAPDSGPQTILIGYRQSVGPFKFRFITSELVTFHKIDSPERREYVAKLVKLGRITM